MTWVRQEDAKGCGLATLAMLCGHSYAQVKARVDGWASKPNDWSEWGCTHHDLDRYLAEQGFFLQRRHDWDRSLLPLEPFADLHYAQVQQPSRNSHFVVVLVDGTVLDPLREGAFRLSDWPAVNQLVGLVKP